MELEIVHVDEFQQQMIAIRVHQNGIEKKKKKKSVQQRARVSTLTHVSDAATTPRTPDQSPPDRTAHLADSSSVPTVSGYYI